MQVSDLQPAVAEVFLAAAATTLVMVAAFIRREEQSARVMRKAAIAVLAAAGLLVPFYGSAPALAFGGLFATSPFAVFMKLLVLAGAAAVLLVSRPHLRADGINRPEFAMLVLFSVLGMMVMVSANDLMALYMGVELQSLPLYAIAAMRRDSLRSSEAGLKYFLLGALSSGILLYGLSMVYGFAGGTNYADVAAALSDGAPPGAVVGIVFMVAGIAFKISAAPFHMWTPDVYEGSPTIVTAFFAIAPKVAAMALFLRMAYAMFGDAHGSWQQVTVALAALSMVVGALGAIMQTDLKRLMAYSSIAHMGYALVGLSAATPAGVGAVVLYMSIYIASAVGVFGIVLGLSREGVAVHRVADLKGFSHSHPWMAACMLVFMFSMAGIPPLGGFFGKWFAFLAAVEAGLVALAVVGVLASVAGAFYYLRIVKHMYFDEAENPLDGQTEFFNGAVVGIAAAVVVLFVFLVAPLRETIAALAPHAASFPV